MKRKNTHRLSPENQARITSIMDAQGICQAARHLGMSRHALERAAGGLTIQAGTCALLEKKLAERDAAGKTP
jgi:hypothetical protein